MPSLLSAETQAVLRSHKQRCAEKIVEVKQRHGTTSAFFDSLACEVIDKPGDSRLAAFYDLYASVFPLEEEREPMEGFAAVLALNGDDAAQAGYGRFYEPIVVLVDPSAGKPVAAANFSIYAYDEALRRSFGFDASCQLHFLLVAPELRGLGLASRLLEIVEAMIAGYARIYCDCSEVRSFMTCEQNNPARMSKDQIEADARAALIDPADRMAWWRKRGYRRLDLDYVQPPLSPEHGPCEYLDYYARPANSADPGLGALPAPVLLEHIRRFFFVSVGKLSGDMEADRVWQATRADLSRRLVVPFVGT